MASRLSYMELNFPDVLYWYQKKGRELFFSRSWPSNKVEQFLFAWNDAFLG